MLIGEQALYIIYIYFRKDAKRYIYQLVRKEGRKEGRIDGGRKACASDFYHRTCHKVVSGLCLCLENVSQDGDWL